MLWPRWSPPDIGRTLRHGVDQPLTRHYLPLTPPVRAAAGTTPTGSHMAERLSQGKPNPFGGVSSPGAEFVVLAQVHAILAVADQLARVAEALDALLQAQQERG